MRHGAARFTDGGRRVYLSAFLFSTTPSIAQLREAAARYQADVVLLFTTRCSLYPEYSIDNAMKTNAGALVAFLGRVKRAQPAAVTARAAAAE